MKNHSFAIFKLNGFENASDMRVKYKSASQKNFCLLKRKEIFSRIAKRFFLLALNGKMNS